MNNATTLTTQTPSASSLSDTVMDDRAELINTIMAAHIGKGRRKPPRLTTTDLEGKPYTYLVAVTESNCGIFLVWFGSGSPADLTEEIYEAIVEEADEAGLDDDHYHIHSKRNLIVTDDVAWHQLPRAFSTDNKS